MFSKLYYLFFAVQSMSVPNFDSSRIPFLNGDNYADWKEKNFLTLGCMDLDLALRVDESQILKNQAPKLRKHHINNGNDLIT